MDRPRLFVELCAGSAAVSLRLVGGPHANPPIGFQGGKRGYARAILGVLGLRQGLGAEEVWLNDAGPWGPVWRVLTTPGKAEDVAAIIRGWKDEEPRALWDRLKAEGWGELTEAGEVAAWTVNADLSVDRSDRFSGGFDAVKCYQPSSATWQGGSPWTTERAASRVEAVARWLYCSGNADANGTRWGLENRTLNHGPQSCLLTRKTLASRLSSWPTPVCAFHGSALDVPIPEDCEGVFCYIDPPYQDTTGYQHDLPREDVITLARRWSDAGAVVCISEAVPIEIEGWHHVEITSERKGQKRTFSNQQREWLTLNREPAWRPSVQVGLFTPTPCAPASEPV
jgi:hypothetical protein